MKSFVCFMVVFVCAIGMVGSEVLFGTNFLTAMGVFGGIGALAALIGFLSAEEY